MGTPRNLHLSYVRLGTRRDVKQHVSLLIVHVGGAFGSDACLVVTVLLHDLPDSLKCTVQLFLVVEFPELQLRGIDDLIRIWAVWSAIHVDSTDEKVGRGRKGKHDAVC